jgi:hypothetical protein
MKTRHKHRDGYYPEHIAQDGEEIHHPLYLADGYRRDLVQSFGAVPDLSLHQAGYRVADQATRDKVRLARQEMIDRATSGWLMDKRRPPDDDDGDDDDDDDDDEDNLRRENQDARDPRAGARAAYDAMCARIQNAWRTPPMGPHCDHMRRPARVPFGRDAAEPDNGSSAETMRRHLRGSDPEDAAEIKERAYQDYVASISQAWKNPSGGIAPQKALVGPGPTSHIERAGEIERLGEQTRGGR